MKKIAIAAAAVLLPAMVSTSAGAGDKPYYIGLSGIATTMNDVDGDNGRGGAGKVDTSADIGTSLGVAVRGGYDFGAMRAEVELAYRDIDVDSISTASGTMSSSSGSVDAYSVMVNGLYDIEMDSAITPYVMAGVGVLKADGTVNYTDDNGRSQSTSADGVAPAGQIGIGATYGISSDLDFVGGYSFMGAPTDASGDSQVLKIHSVQLGVNYKF